MWRISAKEPFDGPQRDIEISSSLKPFSIGKNSNNNYVVKSPFDELVSGRHCEIVLQSSDLYVKDLRSTNGTFVNGSQIESDKLIKLSKDDKIRLGEWDFIDDQTNELLYEGIEFYIKG